MNVKAHPPTNRWEIDMQVFRQDGGIAMVMAVTGKGGGVALWGIGINLWGLAVISGETCRK